MFQFYLGISNLDGPYWTMIIEMLFYILLVILFQFKLLKSLNSIGMALTILIVLITHYLFNNNLVYLIFNGVPILQFWPLFFSGILFYKIIEKNVNKTKYYSMIILCLISQIVLFDYSGRSKDFIDYWEYAFMLISYFSLFTLFVNGKLRFIINKPSLFFGKISYAFYLTHQMISYGFIIPILTNKLNLNFWIASTIALFCSIGLATFVTYFIEIPYSKKMRNKLYTILYKRQ